MTRKSNIIIFIIWAILLVYSWKMFLGFIVFSVAATALFIYLGSESRKQHK